MAFSIAPNSCAVISRWRSPSPNGTAYVDAYEIKMTGDLGATFWGEALIVEEPRVVREPAAFAESDTAHGVIISEWLRTRFRLIWRLASC
jgi:hypothetical protein